MDEKEVKRLKNLFDDNSNKFFDEMGEIVRGDKIKINDLHLLKGRFNRAEKQFKSIAITQEQYDIAIEKVSKKIFEFIDGVAQHASDLKLEQGNEETEVENFIGKFDKEYELLQKLNFTVPLEYFEDLSNTEKPLLPFIIRGDGEKWLYNKLIQNSFDRFGFEHFDTPFIIEFGSNNTFENLLDRLCDMLEIDKKEYESIDTDLKEEVIKKRLLDLMETKSQILIFKRLCVSLIEDFGRFYLILRNLSNQIQANKQINTKCIVLLIENEEHKLSDHEDKFIFMSEIPYSFEAIEIVRKQGLKFIDLGFISLITSDCIKKWFGKFPKHLRNHIINDNDCIQKIISDCDNGHPDKVIPEVCKLININFEQKKELWLKF
jgi:hypothetical protein